MIVFRKAHPATQAMSAARAPADLVDGETRRNPGEPSPAQAEADTYRKPRVEWRGLTIAIENPAGSVRRGTNRHGVSWEIRMRFDYGEVLGSMGVDGDPVDIYLGPALEDAPMVYVVHQRKVGRWDEYDEDKAMAGFMTEEDAKQAFLSNYNDPRFLGPITAMPVDEFITKVRATREKPAMIKAVLFVKAHVGAYLRGGKLVNVAGYQGRNARAVASPGQMSLFGGPASGKPIGPSKYDNKDAQAHTPDLFDADEHGEMPPARRAAREPQHTEPTRELVAEHERLVDVLRSPSHEDDKVEAEKQAKELGELKQEDTQVLKEKLQTLHDFLEVNPGSPSAPAWKAKIAEIEAKIGPLKKDAPAPAKAAVDTSSWSEPAKAAHALSIEYRSMDKLNAKAVGLFKTKLRALAKKTPEDDAHATLMLDGLVTKVWGTDYDPKVADVQFAAPKPATARAPQADYSAALTSTKTGPSDDNPRRKFYVTIAREGRGVSKLAGPFDTHDEAKANVERAREEAYKVDPRSHFDAFGTSGVEADEHKPGVLNDRLGFGAKTAPVTSDDHPAPIPRSLLSGIPEDRRDEWKDLHRQQHELHHYELGQVREKMDRLRSKRNKAESALREAEAGAKVARSAPFPDPAREASADKYVDKTHAEFTKLTREQDSLIGQHQSLYEKVAKLGRAKEKIAGGSGEMDVDFAAMRRRTPDEQAEHEKGMLKMYREHYKAKDAERKRKPAPMTKAIVFLRSAS